MRCPMYSIISTYQCVNQAVRNIVSETEMIDLNGRDRELGIRIAAYVNKMMAKTAEHGDCGVVCQSFIVQSVKIDEKILEANQKIFAAKRQQGFCFCFVLFCKDSLKKPIII